MKSLQEVVVTGIIVPDDLLLILIATGGMTYGLLYRAGLESAHLRVESSQAPSCRGLAPFGQCWADITQQIMQRMKVAISKKSATFEEYMRRISE